MFGLIARADNRGLGQQTWAVYRNLTPAKTLVVNCPSQQPLKVRLDRFPDAQVVDGIPNRSGLEQFCDGLDAIYTAETGYTPLLWQVAQERGVRTVLHANYEFLDRHDKPTVWAAPSLWHFDQFPQGAIHLPVPIETDRLTVEPKPATASRFLHVVGRPAIHDRNGTGDFLQALTMVKSPIMVTITCQRSGYIGALLNDLHIRIPSHINLYVASTDADNYWDLYRGQHAMILPRRFGGLCLPAQEAIGCGLPVVMPNISPNDTWLPRQWLTQPHVAGEFTAKQRIRYYRTEPADLAAVIDRLAQDQQFYSEALTQASTIRDNLSWTTLTPTYRDLLS